MWLLYPNDAGFWIDHDSDQPPKLKRWDDWIPECFAEWRADARSLPLESLREEIQRAFEFYRSGDWKHVTYGHHKEVLIQYHIFKRELSERLDRSLLHEQVGYDS
jgi:hypothetical protein